MSMKNQNRNLSRRKILIGSLQAAGLLLISGCEKLFNGTQENKKFVSLLESVRVENQLGYKHAKYIHKIEFVAELKNIWQGKGGYWEDQGYEWFAGI